MTELSKPLSDLLKSMASMDVTKGSEQMLGFLAFQPEIVGPLFGRKIKAVQTHDALDPFAVRARRTALKPSCSETRRP